MSLVEGRDYVMAEKMTYTGTMGIGKGCLVAGMSHILQLPVRTMQGRGRTMENVEWSIEGRPVAEAVRERLNDPSLAASGLESVMRELAGKLEGSEIFDLSLARRLKVRTSLLSKGLYLSEKTSGPGWRGFPLNRDDARKFKEFYRGHPAAAGG